METRGYGESLGPGCEGTQSSFSQRTSIGWDKMQPLDFRETATLWKVSCNVGFLFPSHLVWIATRKRKEKKENKRKKVEERMKTELFLTANRIVIKEEKEKRG